MRQPILCPPPTPGDVWFGKPDSQVTITFFGNYFDLKSRDAHLVLGQLYERFNGDFRLIYRMSFENESDTQSLKIECALRAAFQQGKFRELHYGLMGHVGPFDNGDLVRCAAEAGVELMRFLRDMYFLANHVDAPFLPQPVRVNHPIPAIFVNDRFFSSSIKFEPLCGYIRELFSKRSGLPANPALCGNS